MTAKSQEKTNGPTKSFMTVGPTLHYSHSNVRRCWMLAVVIFWCCCFFFARTLTGPGPAVDIRGLFDSSQWSLGRFIESPLSIYEYPWQIAVLGLLMGIIAVAPVLTSQLLSFRYSIAMILGVILIARLPLFGIFLALGCAAVACRPLRFRSRFIAIVLCMAPQMVYWAIFGGSESAEPIRWGFSFAPWICAWLTSVAIAGTVIGVGHFTRYRPGLIWIVTLIVLVAATFLFHWKISLAELDYQLYIAENNPEDVSQFHDHNMAEAIDEALKNPGTRSFLAGLFYPTEPALLREAVKREVQEQLRYDRWPTWWGRVPDELKYEAKRQWLLSKYGLFIDKRPNSPRMPTALYYQAMLSEYRPDIRLFGEKEILRFYSDYPHRGVLPIWYKLNEQFGQSPEALEARWRIAMHWSSQGKFDKAAEICESALKKLKERFDSMEENQGSDDTILTVFSRPAYTVMSSYKLTELAVRLEKLTSLIGDTNHTDKDDSKLNLAKFVILNPHDMDYSTELDQLLAQIPKAQAKDKSPLRDNILLAKAMLTDDDSEKAKLLQDIIKKFSGSDGGTLALYELGMLKIHFAKDHAVSDDEKKQFLTEARDALQQFCKVRSESFIANEAKKLLDRLPKE
jgi:hypothetical protein